MKLFVANLFDFSRLKCLTIYLYHGLQLSSSLLGGDSV